MACDLSALCDMAAIGPAAALLRASPAFYRLTRVAQLGAVRVVFPGATHTRAEHSEGVAALAGVVLSQLAATAPCGVTVSDADVATVQLAALAHDLGHPPFGHAFEAAVPPRVGLPDWRHEHMSVALLVAFGEEPGAAAALSAVGVTPTRLHDACEMILGEQSKAPAGWEWRGPPPGREFLWEVVTAAGSGMDVDKLDYLPRDAGACARRALVPCASLVEVQAGMRLLREPDGSIHIALAAATKPAVRALWRARAAMHLEVYREPSVVCLNVAIAEALVAAADVLDLRLALTVRGVRRGGE